MQQDIQLHIIGRPLTPEQRERLAADAAASVVADDEELTHIDAVVVLGPHRIGHRRTGRLDQRHAVQPAEPTPHPRFELGRAGRVAVTLSSISCWFSAVRTGRSAVLARRRTSSPGVPLTVRHPERPRAGGPPAAVALARPVVQAGADQPRERAAAGYQIVIAAGLDDHAVSRTTMRSAARNVDSRCAMTSVVRSRVTSSMPT